MTEFNKLLWKAANRFDGSTKKKTSERDQLYALSDQSDWALRMFSSLEQDLASLRRRLGYNEETKIKIASHIAHQIEDFRMKISSTYRRLEVMPILLEKIEKRKQQPAWESSIKEIYEDLIALDKEYVLEVNFQSETITISLGEEVHLRCPGTFNEITVGPFDMILRFNGDFYFESDGETSISEHIHPHIEGGNLCEGEAAFLIEAAVKEKRIYDLIDVVKATLKTYNPESPHRRIEHWHYDTTCENCNAGVVEEDSFFCEGCENYTCESCLENCYYCSDSTCTCLSSSCHECERTLCEDHRTLCEDCNETHCENCIREDNFCNVNLCSNCSENCGCGNTMCSDCSSHCVDCSDNACNNCITQCEVCSEDTCDGCVDYVNDLSVCGVCAENIKRQEDNEEEEALPNAV